jgi:hypothetical protein
MAWRKPKIVNYLKEKNLKFEDRENNFYVIMGDEESLIPKKRTWAEIEEFINNWIQETKKKCEQKSHILLNLINYMRDKDVLQISTHSEGFDVKTKYETLKVVDGKTWEETKKYIDHTISKRHITLDQCNICFDGDSRFNKCIKCNNKWCINCSLNMLKKNHGIIKCPYCCYQIGNQLNNTDLDYLIERIRHRYNSSSSSSSDSD